MIPLPDVCPHAGSILMDVCLQSFNSYLIVLTGIAALPTIVSLIQSTVLYLTGDPDAFTSKYPAPTNRIVSLTSLPSRLFTDSFPRRSSSSMPELFDLVSALGTNLNTHHQISTL